MNTEFEQIVSMIRTRLCTHSPFFGSLSLYARVETSQKVPTAATDGRTIFINTDFFYQLNADEQEGVYLHEVLHAALLHVPRGKGRDSERWNVAADIVVNGILVKEGYTIPDGSVRNEILEHLSTEEIYDLLQHSEYASLCSGFNKPDLLSQHPGQLKSGSQEGQISQGQQQEIEDYWRNAHEQASVIAETSLYGSLPSYLKRELGRLKASKLNWRHYLWRFLIHTPIDFEGFDRRFVGRRIYLDALTGDTLQVVIGIDTSGSIQQEQLQSFLSEVKGILGAYPHLVCDLYYVDAEAHGPFRLTPNAPPPEPIGGGGTDFRPFFEQINQSYNHSALISVYLTDGYGQFPDYRPPCPILWVVTPNGLDKDYFPFGEVVHLET